MTPSPGAPLTEALRHRVAPLIDALHRSLVPDPQVPLEQRQPLSDWSFSNLLLFREAHDYRLVDGNWPHLTGHAYDGTRQVYPLFDLAQAPLPMLRALLDGQGAQSAFFPLAQAQVQALDAALWVWEARREDADYLYPASHFQHYRGRLLQKKRNLMKQLLAEHRLQVLPYGPAQQGAALQVLEGWLADKHKADGDADDLPCRAALAGAAGLGLRGWLFLADGDPAGFLLSERLAPGVRVVRFAKGLARFKGIAQAMFHHEAGGALVAAGAPPALPLSEGDEPVQWLNFEQDLGLANFRQTKMSYQPAALLPKFRVRLR